jgi:selenocysteine lyase/cysteine desulfurase
LAAVLESGYGILTRAGIHCAPAAHLAIGTSTDGGTTRLSFGPFSSAQDVQFAADALADIAANFQREHQQTSQPLSQSGQEKSIQQIIS